MMECHRTFSASGMFVSNDVMRFKLKYGGNLMYNFKQRFTKSNYLVVNHVYNFNRASSKLWSNKTMIV